MTEILENDIKSINHQSLEKKLKGLIKNEKLQASIDRNRLIGFIIIGVFCIVGLILILAGAFFQKDNQLPIMISLIVVGVILIVIGICASFITPIKNYRLISNTFKSNFSNQKKIEIYTLFFYKFQSIKIENIGLDDVGYFIIKLNDNYQTKKSENGFWLYKDEKQVMLLDANTFNSNIRLNAKFLDNFKGANIDSFTGVAEILIKIKMKNILKSLYEGVDHESNN